MPLVDWALTCDFAYFDPTGRLCVIGADANGVRTLTSGVHRVTVVVHLSGYRDDRLEPALAVRSPSGQLRIVEEGVDFTRERRGNSLLLHLPRISLTEVGPYRVELALGVSEPTMVEVQIVVKEFRTQRAHLHGAH